MRLRVADTVALSGTYSARLHFHSRRSVLKYFKPLLGQYDVSYYTCKDLTGTEYQYSVQYSIC